MFWIITILYIITTPAVYNFLWKAIQPNEMFGAWQRVIDAVYGIGLHKLSDFIGGCQVCFAHFISWLAYIVWVCFTWNIVGYWSLLLWIPCVTFVWMLNLSSKHALDILAEQAKKLKEENDEREQNKYLQ